MLTPRSLIPGFNATLDYYKIKVEDAITAPTAGDVINLCFANITAASATDPACTGIRRNQANGGLSGSTATVPGLPATLSNQGTLKTDGFDLTANYRRNIGFSDLILNFTGNYTRHATFLATPVSAAPPNCPGLYSVNCGISLGQIQPKWSFNQRTTLAFKHVDVSLLWRYISKNKYEPGLPQLGRNCIGNDPDGPTNSPERQTGINGCLITGVGPQVGKVINFNRIPALQLLRPDDPVGRSPITST